MAQALVDTVHFLNQSETQLGRYFAEIDYLLTTEIENQSPPNIILLVQKRRDILNALTQIRLIRDKFMCVEPTHPRLAASESATATLPLDLSEESNNKQSTTNNDDVAFENDNDDASECDR